MLIDFLMIAQVQPEFRLKNWVLAEFIQLQALQKIGSSNDAD